MDDFFPVADAHCDFLYGMLHRNYSMIHPEIDQQITLEALGKGHVKLQFFAAWMDKKLKQPYVDQCLKLIDAYYRMLEQNNRFIPFDGGLENLGDRIGAILAIEGGEAIQGNLEYLRIFRLLGVRAMALTWNYKNEIGFPATGKTNKGLTAFGKSVIAEMNRLNMAIDVSHLNDAGVEDVLTYSKSPIMASHSNAREICLNPRNLSDEQIKQISQKNGFIGVNLFAPHLTSNDECEIMDVVRHIDRIIEIGGIDCVGFGSDYDGMANAAPRGLLNSSGFPALFNALKSVGYVDSQILKIASGNLVRFMNGFSSASVS